MASRGKCRTLLVLRGPALQEQGVLDFLRQQFEVCVAADLDAALEAMRAASFDAVLAETADFLPLERGVVTQQAGVILDTLADGVCVLGPRGELVWANRNLRDAPAEVLEALKRLSARAYEELAIAGAKGVRRPRRYAMTAAEQGRHFEVLYSPVYDHEGLLRQVVAVVVDATSQRRLQQKLDAIDRAGRALVQLESETLCEHDMAGRLRLLEERIIRCSREVLDYQHFAVLLLHEDTGRLELIASAGLPEEVNRYRFYARKEGNGICGYVAATGRSYVCPDVRKDAHYLPGMEGAKSSLTVPLRLHDRVVGVLNVEADRLRAFAEEDRQFAEIFANHVALALHVLHLLVRQRDTARAEARDRLSGELARPLEDIAAEARRMLEESTAGEELRRRLEALAERAAEAGRRLRRRSTGPQGPP